MGTLVLLRSFGDFVIAIHALKSASSNPPCQFLASSHLEALYEALQPHLPASLRVTFRDIGIRTDIFSGFTNRHLASRATFHELAILRKVLRQEAAESPFFLEQSRRSLLVKCFTGQSFQIVHSTGNIYDSYQRFFSDSAPESKKESIGGEYSGNFNRVLVFPDSRMSKKALAPEVLQPLETGLRGRGSAVEVARFGKSYSNFPELVQLVQQADFVVSSDSLPVHLAQLFEKPHAIFYARSLNREWMTPFSRNHQTGFVFDEVGKFLERWPSITRAE